MAKKPDPPVQSASEATGSKSTALSPMIWLIGLLSPSISVSAFAGPTWLRICLVALLTVSVIAFIGQCIYFGIMKPDLLRTENYNLKKLELSKLGDDRHGFFDHTINVSGGQIDNVSGRSSITQASSPEATTPRIEKGGESKS